MNGSSTTAFHATLAEDVKRWGVELGFQQVGICDTDLTLAEVRFGEWSAQQRHGEMDYMVSHGSKRSRPQELVPGTIRIISVRMDYLPADDNPMTVLENPALGYISRYALGRDYHKMMRNRLQKLARRIEQACGEFGYRAFVDSAPVLEKPLAQKAGLGWQGKHSNLVNRHAGGWFFLGELYTDLPLPVDDPEEDHCGRCSACIDICPTQAIVAPYEVDARRCISYLTIELHGAIPLELRSLVGNRIYGCDDCLLVCPWNRFAQPTAEQDFMPRQGLESSQLVELFAWSEDEFLKRMEGSPIRRIGHQRWLRNIAVALGNADTTPEVIQALAEKRGHPSELVAEHVDWALARHDTG
ncbi:MAG: tRNA epoxyqueuosine(34) reductase QueG [Candidatus Sedimenticola sp. 20ELBAFRAG]